MLKGLLFFLRFGWKSDKNIPATIQNTGTQPILKKPHEIVLQNVSFRYKGQEHYALKNINLTIRPGEKISIVGEKRVNAILKQVGFAKRLATLSKGLRTHVHKLFEEDGFEPSGGEGQKIAIARALYRYAAKKKTPCTGFSFFHVQ